MRGDDREQGSMFSDRSLEDRIPADHPLRPMRAMVGAALADVSPRFEAVYARVGRPSIPPERLLRALLLQILFSVRSERRWAPTVASTRRTSSRAAYNLVRLRSPTPASA